MDKASVLARVIEQVRALDQNAANISKTNTIPSSMNRVIVECENGRRSNFSSSVDEEVRIKATLFCDEQPDLISDLMEAFDRLKLTAIRAELTSLGGRSHNTFTLCIKDGNRKVCINSQF
ncbi:Transcription factor bHLH51 [Platanthera guangdongensis]|uniref:Transcription factor bHLH51 n=1 Tax=Platanthera guangdongensis TaxID=2320717 RepID=A0ABR2M212_9ASPA